MFSYYLNISWIGLEKLNEEKKLTFHPSQLLKYWHIDIFIKWNDEFTRIKI